MSLGDLTISRYPQVPDLHVPVRHTPEQPISCGTQGQGISIRKLAAAAGLSPSRVPQIVADADLDTLDAALGELRAAGWPAAFRKLDALAVLTGRLSRLSQCISLALEPRSPRRCCPAGRRRWRHGRLLNPLPPAGRIQSSHHVPVRGTDKLRAHPGDGRPFRAQPFRQLSLPARPAERLAKTSPPGSRCHRRRR